MNNPSFFAFITGFKDLDSAVGDLARDIWEDEDFPATRPFSTKDQAAWDYMTIHSYLEEKATTSRVLTVFRQTYAIYLFLVGENPNLVLPTEKPSLSALEENSQ